MSRSRTFPFPLAAIVLSASVMTAQTLPVNAAPLENLNLSTRQKTEVAPNTLSAPVTIVSGGREKTVTAGMSLTPAQLVALQQVLATGTQTLVLNGNGRAIGGSMNLPSSQTIASLTVPKNVSVIGDFSGGAPLNLAGNINNAGSLFAVSVNNAVTNAVISAYDINNRPTGLISSVLPTGGLVGFPTALSTLDLSLIAVNNLINEGTISSSGNLNLVAGNTIANSTAGVLSAVSNVNIATQNLINTSLISAGANISVAEQVIRNAQLTVLQNHVGTNNGAFSALSELHDLIVDNSDGVLSALGDINFDHANATKGISLVVWGGDLLSRNVHVDAKEGTVVLGVNELSGVLNVKAGAANLGASTPSLSLGEITVLGDPTIYNANGDVNIDTDQVVTESLTILASGSVNIDTTLQDILFSTAGSTSAKNITVVAGVLITPLNGAPPNGQLVAPGIVQASGPSLTGGNIYVSGGNSLDIDSTSTTSGVKGGNVYLAAYGGSIFADPGGQINIVTDASDGAQAGNVTIVAPSLISSIDIEAASDVTPVGLSVRVANAQPIVKITAASDGSITGTLAVGAVNPTGTVLLENDIDAPSGTVTINAGDRLEWLALGDLITKADTPGASGGAVTLTAVNNIYLKVNIDTRGEDGADGIDGVGAGAAGAVGMRGGNGGNVLMTALNEIRDIAGGNVTINTSAGKGGDGGDGSDGNNTVQTGGAGGAGGVGGRSGSFTATSAHVNFNLGSFTGVAGDGGDGGDGGNAFDPGNGIGASGGAGGAGGNAGLAGPVTLTGLSHWAIAPSIDVSGGDGGDGGSGGRGGGDNSGNFGDFGGVGGAGGAGGNASAGGIVKVLSSKNIVNVTGTLRTDGGDGGASGDGGRGGDGGIAGGKGGFVNLAGLAGAAGAVTIIGANGVALRDISANGGNGGAAEGRGGDGGDGVNSTGIGGAGGAAGTASPGGLAAKIIIASSLGEVLGNAGNPYSISANGGSGGAITGKGGDGGDGGNNGRAGNGGRGSIGAVGAPGGLISIKAAGNVTNLATSQLRAQGGAGSGASDTSSSNPNGGDGGDGGGLALNIGAAGGAAGIAGHGGKGGLITITAPNILIDSDLGVAGGAGGGGLIRGGKGGDGLANTIGGPGGSGPIAGNGGLAGKILLTAKTGSIQVEGIDATGGFGGSLEEDTGSLSGGGDGGDGQSGGGVGGLSGRTGSGAAGGLVTLKALNSITVDDDVDIFGGFGGDAEASGGSGGKADGASAANGGNGGAAGLTGNGGKAGAFLATTVTGAISVVDMIRGDGGNGGRYLLGGGGDGGEAQGTAFGGAGGLMFGTGFGGAGGIVTLRSSDNDVSVTGDISLKGGTGGLDQVGGGNGGDAPDSGAVAGKGGAGGLTGKGGIGGKLTISSLGEIFLDDVTLNGGSGGDVLALGGEGGVGSSNGGVGGIGGLGGSGGAGGIGGALFITQTGSVGVDIVGNVSLIGGGGGDAGIGGLGGDGNLAGTAGNGGNGGLGAKGGTVSIKTTSLTAQISLAGNLDARGGAGGNGGNGGDGGDATGGGSIGGTGGNGGNGGNGGDGGPITIVEAAGLPVLLGATTNSGGAGGLRGNFGSGGSPVGTDGQNGSAGIDGDPGPQIITEEPDDDESDSTAASSGKRYKPVAFVQPALALSDRVLPAANVLLMPTIGTVRARVGIVSVDVKKGASAFVINKGRDVCILSLHDRLHGDVSVSVGGQVIKLRAGEQVLVTNSTQADWNAVCPVPNVAVRGGTAHGLSDGNRAFVCEFSIPSAISHLKALQGMAKSDDGNKQAMFSKIMKNAAALHMVTGAKGPYKSWPKSPRTIARAL